MDAFPRLQMREQQLQGLNAWSQLMSGVSGGKSGVASTKKRDS